MLHLFSLLQACDLDLPVLSINRFTQLKQVKTFICMINYCLPHDIAKNLENSHKNYENAAGKRRGEHWRNVSGVLQWEEN